MTKLVYAPKIRVFKVSFISPVCVEFVNDFTYRRMGLGVKLGAPSLIGAYAYMRGNTVYCVLTTH